ncbi:ABC transporter ATP-binding protein [Chthonobacter rhizosphaerae]|uniref:ABC transporter ATP-binding protein n=1 Tax=Chthonobacter rhizosphaerae TaxID=2735553 RepID=UPI0015EF1430|nr:sn-glycerol-3-phosphate ABC transporter ATP-binding protein UgpC [Chthonobacter rhizosphaerae]
MASLSIERLKKSYGAVEIIKGVDLSIADGEFVVFVGPSGCGKSTLLRMIAGLEEITSGELKIDGAVVNDLAPKERGIAMVFQSYALYPHKTVYDNMAFGLQIAGTDKAEIDAKVRNAARILKMEHLLDRRPNQLSGGQRQRVAIGRAIVRNPKVFLFDEPLSNLDAALRVTMRAELAKLHRDLAATMIYVTHDQVEAMTLADTIVVLEGGNVRQAGSPLELYHLPRNLFVAGFIGSPKMNMLPATVSAVAPAGLTVSAPWLAPTVIPVNPGGVAVGATVTVGIRPEHIQAGEGAVSVTGTVGLVERLGHQTIVEIAVSGGGLTALIDGETMTSPGETLTVGFHPKDAHVFDAAGEALTRLVVPEIAKVRKQRPAA